MIAISRRLVTQVRVLLVIVLVSRLWLAATFATATPKLDTVTEYRNEVLALVEKRQLQEAIDKIDYGFKSGVLKSANLRLIRCWILLLDLQMMQTANCLDEYTKFPHTVNPDLLINYNKVSSSMRSVQEILDADHHQEYEKVLRLTAEIDAKVFWRLESYRAKSAAQVYRAPADDLLPPTPTLPLPWWRRKIFWIPTALGSAVILGFGLTLGLTPRPYHDVAWPKP